MLTLYEFLLMPFILLQFLFFSHISNRKLARLWGRQSTQLPVEYMEMFNTGKELLLCKSTTFVNELQQYQLLKTILRASTRITKSTEEVFLLRKLRKRLQLLKQLRKIFLTLVELTSYFIITCEEFRNYLIVRVKLEPNSKTTTTPKLTAMEVELKCPIQSKLWPKIHDIGPCVAVSTVVK